MGITPLTAFSLRRMKISQGNSASPSAPAATDRVHPALSFSVPPGTAWKTQSDFTEAAAKSLSGTLLYVTFSAEDSLSPAAGMVYSRFGQTDEQPFTRSGLDGYRFYSDSGADDEYYLSDLSFAAPAGAASRTVRLAYVLHNDRNDTAAGTVEISLNAVESVSPTPVPRPTATPSPLPTATPTPELP